MEAIIIGAGLAGCITARHLAEHGVKANIYERRGHIGGNLYDYVDEHGFLVQKYGPHAFHTVDPEIYAYICRFEEWEPYRLRSGAMIDDTFTPVPFNFTTIDTFYAPDKAAELKRKLQTAFPGRDTVTVTEVLGSDDPDIAGYARFLFEKDYRPYTAKQWGMQPEEVDPSVLKRVPLRLSYANSYFDDAYQVMPKHSYAAFFRNLTDHENISIELNINALEHLELSEQGCTWDGKIVDGPVIYTGALDELFDFAYGALPYRSLAFRWEHTDEELHQDAPIVACPMAEGYTRITEYKQLPPQHGSGTSFALEYPVQYQAGGAYEPYYPIQTAESGKRYQQYQELAGRIPNLITCGRLADFKYYNMDQTIRRALEVCDREPLLRIPEAGTQIPHREERSL